MNIVGRSEVRVDAFDKATGRTKYYDDLAPKDALLIRVKHSTIAHGFVKSVDISKAEKIPGVVKILTCFDVPDIPFPTLLRRRCLRCHRRGRGRSHAGRARHRSRV